MEVDEGYEMGMGMKRLIFIAYFVDFLVSLVRGDFADPMSVVSSSCHGDKWGIIIDL